MDCTLCRVKSCRHTETCASLKFEPGRILSKYHELDNQKVIQAASLLVDHGRAGTLSRLDEIIEFSREMNFSKIGLAYCYGMEKEALQVSTIFRESGFKITPVSCTAGGFKQKDVNLNSNIEKVSCNPLAQATQLNHEGVDLTITMGLCLGHDMLFQKQIESYTTTLLVKDRIYNHNPAEALNNQNSYIYS